VIEREQSPLSDDVAVLVMSLLRQAEENFGAPQDLEWTLRGRELFALQSRPITTGDAPDASGDRAWYLSLHKSLAALHTLRQAIEEELLPAMERDALCLAAVDLEQLSDEALPVKSKSDRGFWTAGGTLPRDVHSYGPRYPPVRAAFNDRLDQVILCFPGPPGWRYRSVAAQRTGRCRNWLIWCAAIRC